MSQKKKKGSQPKNETPKRKKQSASQIIFSIVAVFMVLTMIVPLLLSFFQ